jgi:rSAM/selenodomain-associated transferase 2
MRISIVLPVFNEERIISATLAGLKRLKPDEVIVVDGGSTDRTREIAQSLGVTLIYSSRGHGRQMNHGTRQATGDVLLHADTRLPGCAFDDIREALADPRCVGGRFDVKLDGESWMLRIVGAMISLRSRITKVSTGDQAIFVRREVFEKISGYPDIPLMEDIAHSRTLKHMGRLARAR